MNISGLESRIKELKIELEEYEKTFNKIRLYLEDTRKKIDGLLLTPSGVIHNGYTYPSIQELYNELISDIELYKNFIFFKEEGKKLLEQGYDFLNYNDDGTMTTNQSSILKFNGGSFVKNEQLISINGGIIKKYTIIDNPMQNLKRDNIILENKNMISPSCFLYNENGELFFIIDGMFDITKMYKIIEINDNLS